MPKEKSLDILFRKEAVNNPFKSLFGIHYKESTSYNLIGDKGKKWQFDTRVSGQENFDPLTFNRIKIINDCQTVIFISRTIDTEEITAFLKKSLSIPSHEDQKKIALPKSRDIKLTIEICVDPTPDGIVIYFDQTYESKYGFGKRVPKIIVHIKKLRKTFYELINGS